VRFLALVQRGNVRLQLRVRGRGVATTVADVGSLTGVRALVVIFGLICREGLRAGGEAACVGPVAAVAEQVTRQLGALFEVLGGGVAGLPVAEAGCAVVDVGGFGVGVQGGRGGEAGEAEDVWRVLPADC